MTGAGKSTLGNVLLGYDPLCNDCMFPWCDGLDSCTKETTYAVGSYLGDGVEFTVVDTPGFGDSDGEDSKNIEEMMQVLNKVVKSANTILLLVKGDDSRFGEGLTTMIREMTMLFGESMWNNVIIGVSFWAYDQESIDHRHEDCEDEYYPDRECHDEEWLTAAINTQLQEKVHLPFNLSAVFIDSYSQKGRNKNDTLQQKYFRQETSKLLEFMKTKEDFFFRTINDILIENAQMKEELDCLNGVINEDISELNEIVDMIKGDNEDMKIDISHNRELISNNIKQIGIQEEQIKVHNDQIANNSKHISQNEDLINANQENIIITNEKIDTIEETFNLVISELKIKLETMEQQMAGLLIPPLGTIMAWVPKPSADASPISLPDGWVECDGQLITEGIWNNLRTPNLNGEGLFLRGGSQSNVLEIEGDLVRDLLVWDRYTHTNECAAEEVEVGTVNIGTGAFDDRYCKKQHALSEWNNFMGAETRPKNMKVTYIMRIK